MPNQWRIAPVIVLLVILFGLLTGCAKGTAHVTVQRNGGVDIALHLRLDARAQSLINGKVEDSLISKLEAAGIELQKIQDGPFMEYQYLKSYAPEDIRSMMDERNNSNAMSKLVDTNVQRSEHLLYTTYDIETQLITEAYSDKLIQQIETLNVPKPVIQLLMQSFAIDFKLTLPFNLYGDNNAAEQEGRTLTWPITLMDPQPIRMEIHMPNVRNIVVALVGTGLMSGVIIVYFIRKRRKGRKR